MEYLDWNKAIFEYFFYDISENSDVLFSVDEYILKEIGNKNGLNNPVLDFCNAVNKETVILNNRQKPVFRLNNIGTDINNGIPFQTSVIAFLVLAASKMGEDVLNDSLNDDNIVERNYSTQLKKLLNYSRNEVQNIEFTSFGNIFENNFEKYKQLFHTFSEYIEENYNCKVEFRELFKKGKRKRNDWIGIPIFQSMISRKDYAVLTQYFEKYQSAPNINTTKNLSEFSRVFNNIVRDYPKLLQNRINTLFQNWDGYVIEYDKKDKRTTRVAHRNISPVLLYEQTSFTDSNTFIKNYDKYNFYEALPKIKNLDLSEIIKTDEREYVWNNALECYCSKSFYISSSYFKTSNVKTSSNKIDIIYNLAHKKWILFKYENGIYKSVENAFIGDTISVLCLKSNELDTCTKNIKECTSETTIINCQKINNTRYNIIGPVKVIKENTILGIKDIEKISLSKGLKNGYKLEYLKGAEPVLSLTKKLKNSKSICRIDETIINFTNTHNKVDLRIQYNSLGQHQIQLTNGEKKNYTIVNSFYNNTENEFKIYLQFINCNLHKNVDFSTEKNLINGCFIENCDLQLNIEIPPTNITIVNNILKAIYKKNDTQQYKNFVIKNKFDLTDNITLRYLKETE